VILKHQANILLTEGGDAQLADFGLTIVGDGTVDRMTTQSGEQGTLRWMSPERLDGATKRLQPTDDVYAFACLCYTVGKHHAFLVIDCMLIAHSYFRARSHFMTWVITLYH
jgi:serine/threonine protein kinase